MKCPYNGFKECIIEKCPSCNYEVVKEKVLVGRSPSWMSLDAALERGCQWYETKTSYKFVSCQLIEKGATPTPPDEVTVNNNIRNTNVAVAAKKGYFF